MTGEIPFRQVYIHGLVRDADKQKMSKTKGNVIDPLVVTEKFGTDAVRLALLQGAAPGTDIVLTEERMESARGFANKLWNASRFLFMNMERSNVDPWLPSELDCCRPEADPASITIPLEDRWIFSRLNKCAEQMNRAIEQYRYHEAAQTIWAFTWHEFCDWYIELKKLRFEENSGINANWRNLITVYEMMLRLLHPVMPFVTEELWHRLSPANEGESIALAHYPQYNPLAVDLAAEQEMAVLQEIVTEERQMRHDVNIPSSKADTAKLQVRALDASTVEALLPMIERLTRTKFTVEVGESSEGARFKILRTVEMTDAQRARIQKEMEQLEKVIASSKAQLGNDVFTSRAPAHVIDGIRNKLVDYEAQLAKLSAM
jgi:valyl-tRNA synthetase